MDNNNNNNEKERSLYYRACAKSNARTVVGTSGSCVSLWFRCYATANTANTAPHCTAASRAKLKRAGSRRVCSTPTSLYSRENGRLYLCGRPPLTSTTTTERKSNGTRRSPTTKGPARPPARPQRQRIAIQQLCSIIINSYNGKPVRRNSSTSPRTT